MVWVLTVGLLLSASGYYGVAADPTQVLSQVDPYGSAFECAATTQAAQVTFAKGAIAVLQIQTAASVLLIEGTRRFQLALLGT